MAVQTYPQWLRAGRQIHAATTGPRPEIMLARPIALRQDRDGSRYVVVELPESRSTGRSADQTVPFYLTEDGNFRWRNFRLAPPFEVDSPAYLEWLATQLAGELSRAATRVRMVDQAAQLDLIEDVQLLLDELSATLYRAGHAISVERV